MCVGELSAREQRRDGCFSSVLPMAMVGLVVLS